MCATTVAAASVLLLLLLRLLLGARVPDEEKEATTGRILLALVLVLLLVGDALVEGGIPVMAEVSVEKAAVEVEEAIQVPSHRACTPSQAIRTVPSAL